MSHAPEMPLGQKGNISFPSFYWPWNLRSYLSPTTCHLIEVCPPRRHFSQISSDESPGQRFKRLFHMFYTGLNKFPSRYVINKSVTNIVRPPGFVTLGWKPPAVLHPPPTPQSGRHFLTKSNNALGLFLLQNNTSINDGICVNVFTKNT